MKRLVVQLELVLDGYEDDEVFKISKDNLGEMVFQSDCVIQDCLIKSWKIENA